MTERERKIDSIDVTFNERFGRKPEYVGRAPGRVNLIGEHTDYNDGFVLPTAIPQVTTVALAFRDDNLVRLTSQNVPDEMREYRLGEEKKTGHWIDYLQGLTRFFPAPEKLRGFDVAVHSEVPMGLGLSSSAALEMAAAKALWHGLDLNWDPIAVSRLCQRVENEFVGARVGIMDPMAVALASFGTAVFLDTKTLRYEKVELPVDAIELVVINSGVSHRNVGGDYNTRRQECERACQALGISSLREVTDLGGTRALESLPEPLGRRARHVVSENQRVLDAVAAIRARDFRKLGQLFNESHRSMRDDYEVSIPEIDYLVDAAQQIDDVCGARLTGGGFGGSVVILTSRGKGREIARRVSEKYTARFSNLLPSVLLPVGNL